jgi:outer membrane biosynthesis protein TonB
MCDKYVQLPVPRSPVSVEAMDSMSEMWRAWQGREINTDLRLGRYLGGSDHSAVFLADPAAVAVKLVPAWPALAESQLSDWSSAAGLAHPHLIRLLETGRCELDGQPCLYAVMEYADQNLAQLLKHRPLSEKEAREILPPALDALAYLHGRNLVQGQIKPANILAVGDQLKLAADTVRRVSETRSSRGEPSSYDPPEAREGSYATAGDVWGLGMTLVEALTCRLPAIVGDARGGVELPRDFPPTFRELVTWCLSRRPYDRPKVTEIEAWLRRRSAVPVKLGAQDSPATAEAVKAPPVPPQVQPTESPQKPTMEMPQITQPIPAETPGPDLTASETPKRRSFAIPLAVAALLGLSWVGIHALRAHRGARAAAAAATLPTASQPAAPAPGGTATLAAAQAAPAAAAVPAVLHAEIPDVPRRARQTIHGHIKVSVRVIIDRNGNVVAALADHPGPSRYFERLALAAAKKWTFPQADTPVQRVDIVHFEFSRDGTTGHAAPVR